MVFYPDIKYCMLHAFTNLRVKYNLHSIINGASQQCLVTYSNFIQGNQNISEQKPSRTRNTGVKVKAVKEQT